MRAPIRLVFGFMVATFVANTFACAQSGAEPASETVGLKGWELKGV